MAQQKLISKPTLTITRTLDKAVTTPCRFVMATANEGEVKVADAANALCEGVLPQSVAAAGDRATIEIEGISVVQVGAAVDRNKFVISDDKGRAVPCPMTSGTTYNIMALALSGASAENEFISVQQIKAPSRIKS